MKFVIIFQAKYFTVRGYFNHACGEIQVLSNNHVPY